MDISLIIFLSVVLVFAVRGYRCGLTVVLSRIVSYLVAYVAAYSFAKPVSLLIQSFLPISGLLSYIIAGILLFVLASIITSLIFSVIIKMMNNNAETGKRASISGGLLGASAGILFGFLAVWFYATIADLANAKKGLPPLAQTQFQQSARNLTTVAVKSLVSGVSKNPDVNAVSSALLTNPVENIERYKRLSNSGDLQNLFQNPSAKNALNNLNPDQLMRQKSFKQLIANPDFIALTKEFNLPAEPKQMQKEVAVKMTTAWAQINQVKNDPQFIAITQDPEVRQMLETKDIIGLLNNNKIEQLLNIVTSAKTAELNFEVSKKSQTEEPSGIYRRVDEKGNVHYSDKPDSDKAKDE